MKIFLFYTGLLTLAISLTHGFFTEQSVVHMLLFHPFVILFSFILIAYGSRKKHPFNCSFR
ncbi:hypothetical protein D4741_16970 [Pseudoalteromonas gelatinilytica]|uniref:Uncharacterized protein n=1 Tax=Pseudoalteromonas gelatinilytica TaxID=1703256 RepID=A0A3A3EFS6_9GAMM|nr:hypothetical protein D4741_16970 [Pseudoalteromonas profundi]